jgi:hypothetical protein
MVAFCHECRFNGLKLTDRSQVSELESELKLKKFELGRLSILFTETQEKYKSVMLDKEKALEKLEVKLSL